MKSLIMVLAGALTLMLVDVAAPAQEAAPTPTPPTRIRNHFDFDEPIRTPAYFDFVVLGAPGEASWKVLVKENPPSYPNVACQVLPNRPADSIAVALRRNVSSEDGSWSVALEKGSGRGGIVFRMASEKEYRALLIDLRTGEASLTAVDSGRLRELASGQAKLDRAWGVLAMTVRGDEITATFEGQPLLTAHDPHSVAGRVGMATTGPGTVCFDEFILEPGPK